MARAPARTRKPAPPPVEISDAGPTDFADPATRREVKRAAVWIGIAALVVLTVFLAQPLLVIFGGMVFAATIDGGARLLGRVLPIGRGWRVGIVLLLAVLFAVWTAWFCAQSRGCRDTDSRSMPPMSRVWPKSCSAESAN
jgi:putative permease